MGLTVDLKDLVRNSHAYAVSAGFWPPLGTRSQRDEALQALALVVSEIGEAVEEARLPTFPEAYTSDSGKPEGFASELADIIIRVCDLAGRLEIDLAAAIAEKARYNLSRPWKHGKEA